MKGSSILHDWVKVRDKKNIRKKNRIVQPYRHLLCIRLYNGIYFFFFFSSILLKKEIESIRSGSLNDPFTTLPFVGVKKILWWFCCFIYLFCLWFNNPKVPFWYDQIRKKMIFFFSFLYFFFHNINIRKRILVWKRMVCDAEMYPRHIRSNPKWPLFHTTIST